MVLRLLFFSPVLFGVSSSVGGAGSGAGSAAFALLFAIIIAASAAAFFCCSRARRVLSATNLPAATRLGFFTRCGVVVGFGVVACCVISTCECAVWVSPCECALSDCSVDILKRSVYVKQIKLLCNYSEFVWNCSAVGEVC